MEIILVCTYETRPDQTRPMRPDQWDQANETRPMRPDQTRPDQTMFYSMPLQIDQMHLNVAGCYCIQLSFSLNPYSGLSEREHHL